MSGPGARSFQTRPTTSMSGLDRCTCRRDLVSFHCPSWTQPFPPETTLATWIGVRCRTVTTPQAGAFVTGTELSVMVSGSETIFWVFEGQIEVSDLAGGGAVLVGPGQTTTVLTGKTPTTPVAFDTSDPSLRWWNTGPSDTEIAAIIFVSVSLFFLVYFLPAIVVLVRRPEHWQLVGLVDLLAAWTVIGWVVPWSSPSPCPAPVRPPPGRPCFLRMEGGGGTGKPGDPCPRGRSLARTRGEKR